MVGFALDVRIVCCLVVWVFGLMVFGVCCYCLALGVNSVGYFSSLFYISFALSLWLFVSMVCWLLLFGIVVGYWCWF